MTDENGTYLGNLIDERTAIVEPIAIRCGHELFKELVESGGSPCETVHGVALAILSDIVADTTKPLPPNYEALIHFVRACNSEAVGGVH